MTASPWQLLIVLAIVLLLFGRGKIPQLMGDIAKGIKSFKKGISDEDGKDDIDNNSKTDKTQESKTKNSYTKIPDEEK